MMTAQEMTTARTQRANREAAMASARSWAANDRKYTDDKSVRRIVRDCVKNARKANRKLVAALAAGSARPVSIVMAAVLPLMEDMAKHAADFALNRVAQVRAQVAQEGLDVAFPKAAELADADRWNRVKRAQRDRQNERRAFAERITGKDGDEHVALYVESEVFSARRQFVAYADKLTLKVGKVTAATLETVRGVWGESYLTVTTEAGAVERWKTQTIVNRSVLDLLFYQWPTRKVKS